MSTSWVIKDRTTGNVIAETFSTELVKKIKAAGTYDVVPILEHLASVNMAARAV